MDDFLWRAILGAAFLAAACGPIGCFVLWKRMAYLGESVAHVGLLGAGLGLLLGVNVVAGTAALAIVAALIMARAADRAIPAGTFVGIVGHMGLALGFVVLATLETVRADLLGYLFGDVLALSTGDVAAVAGVSAVVLAATVVLWRPLLKAAVGGDIAAAEGHGGPLVQTAFLVLVALLVAFGLKVVGALLIVALLIVPPAAARAFARTPESMAVQAALAGAVAAPLGVGIAYAGDLPAGPAIVLAAGVIFALTTAAARLRDNLKRA
ncbi:MAG: metal ABC transporter permease [Alphaproteobacteria bacterium]|nr:metal ABC transporter permease [Alphaproteobacteria bacterium]